MSRSGCAPVASTQNFLDSAFIVFAMQEYIEAVHGSPKKIYSPAYE